MQQSCQVLMDAHHTQVLERLKQLRIWQQQQQEQLLAQHQLELRTHPSGGEGGGGAGTTGGRRGGNLQPEGHTISGSSLHSNDSGLLTGQSSAIDVKDKQYTQDNEEQDNEGGSSGFMTPESHGISEHDEGVEEKEEREDWPTSTSLPHDEVPVNPGIGPGSASTFEELLERKLKQYQGDPPLVPSNATGCSQPMHSCLSEDSFIVRGIERQKVEEAELQEFELLEKAADHDMSFSSQCSLVTRLLNKDSGNPPVVSSSPKTVFRNKRITNTTHEEDQKSLSFSPVHETQSHSNNDTNVQPQSHSKTHSHVSVPSHSQSSETETLHTHSTSHSKTSPQSNAHSQTNNPHSHFDYLHSRTENPHSYTDHPHSYSSPHSHFTSSQYPLLPHPQSHGTLSHPQSRATLSHSHSRLTPVLPYIDEEEPIMDELDSTLKHSEVEFEDNDIWDSFTDDTPMKTMGRATPQDTPLKEAELNERVCQGQMGPSGAVRKVRILSEPIVLKDVDMCSSTTNPVDPMSGSLSQSNEGALPKRPLYNPELPPPSALVAKLFPSLRKERDAHKSKYIQSLQLPVKKQEKSSANEIPMATPLNTEPKLMKPETTETSTSTLDKQVKEKLKELEEEISRFKKENITLDNLRREREEVLFELKQELIEFNKQKDDQMKAFEEYKMEEIRKLKKERKVFEAYQRETNATRDQKMKEEVISLRQEIEDLRDEMKSKDSRWVSTVSRYRIRIDSLESQNSELQNDLRVMEEQRLLWWQQQLEAKRSPMAISRRTPPRVSSSCSPSQIIVTEDKGKRTNTLDKGKQRRQSDPPKKMVQHNKENKKPLAKGPSSSGSTSNSKKKAKKQSVTCGVKSTLKQNNKIPIKAPQVPLQSIETNVKHSADNGDNEGVASGYYDDECEIIEVRGVDHPLEEGGKDHEEQRSLGDDDEVAEDIVNNILNDDEPSKLRSIDSSTIKRSVRFQDMPSSKGAEPMGEPLPLTYDTDSEDEQVTNGDIQKIHVEEDGTKVVLFPNGTKKMISLDGVTSTVYYFNGDIKRILSDGTVVYIYSKCQTVHKTFSDGKEIIEFTNGQTESRFPNGDKAINFPDGTARHVYHNGQEKVVFSNGTIQYTQRNGEKTIEFTDGQKEIHTTEYKRRVYPDGTIKTVYLDDGRQETQYANGTIKLKDKHGRLISAG